MIEAILFDLGDTLINFGKLNSLKLFREGARASYDYLASQNRTLPPYDRYWQAHYRAIRNAYYWSTLRRRDFDVQHVVTAVIRKLGIHVNPRQRRELLWVWYRPIFEVAKVDDGLHEMLAMLRDAGTKLAIVSNTFMPGHNLDRHLEREGLLEFFPVRVYS